MTLPINRSKLTLAQGNQVPSLTASSTKNIEAITEAYDTIDELNTKQDIHSSSSTLAHPDGSVTNAKIANGAITESKIANGSITAAKFVPGALTNETANALRISALEYRNAPKKMRVDGDSFTTLGDGKAGHLFWERISRAKNLTPTNAGVGGSIVNDVWHLINRNVTIPSPFDVHIINIGFNDVRSKGNNPLCANDIASRIRGVVGFLRLKSLKFSSDHSIVYSGTWNTISTPLEEGDFHSPSVKYTSEQGAYVETTFEGNAFTIGTFFLETVGSTVELRVGGNLIEKINTGVRAIGDYSPTALEFSGFGSGTHTLRMTKTSIDDKNIFIDYIGTPQVSPPMIYVNGITRMRDDVYTMFGPVFNKGSDKAVSDTNLEMRKVLASFDEKVAFVDQGDFDPDTIGELLLPDGVHPSGLGHEWISSNVLKRWT